jgi:hypothetical protein
VTVVTGGSSTNSDESFQRYEDFAIRSLNKVWLGTSDATDAGPNGSYGAVNTRASVTMDPRMKMDGMRLSSTERRTIARRMIFENPHKFGAPITTVPVPMIMLKTADDEVRVDAGDKAREQRAEGQRPYEVRGSIDDKAPVAPANDNAPHIAPAVASAPAAPVEAAAGVDVQKQALNGAQLTSLADLVARAADGKLPRASALKMITIAFPTVSAADADELLGTIGQGFVPAADPAQQPAAVTPPALPPPTSMSAPDPKAGAPARRRGRTKTSASTRSAGPLEMALLGQWGASTSSSRARPPKP